MSQSHPNLDSSTATASRFHSPIMIIDVHHHVFLDAQKKIEKNAQVGWITPPEHIPWKPLPAISAMDTMGIQTAMLSPPPIATTNASEVRAMNVYLSQLRAAYPTRFGFLAGLPTLCDVQGALSEITFAMDHLDADGFALVSSYGTGNAAKYIADDLFDPIWEELNRRHAVVFLHGAQTPSSTPYPHPFLGIPISEASIPADRSHPSIDAQTQPCIPKGKKRLFSNVKIILAHLGGSTLFLAPRVAALSHYMGCPLSPDEILHDFKAFYFETALSSHPTTLVAIDTFVPSDRVLFGSDYPGTVSLLLTVR
ncbi:hypothetical protein JVU11DRAFT_1594 [Chiua virens]|nr:hypothetical protein JVU11DRAFT_1594 [Chiua virens]